MSRPALNDERGEPSECPAAAEGLERFWQGDTIEERRRTRQAAIERLDALAQRVWAAALKRARDTCNGKNGPAPLVAPSAPVADGVPGLQTFFPSLGEPR